MLGMWTWCWPENEYTIQYNKYHCIALCMWYVKIENNVYMYRDISTACRSTTLNISWNDGKKQLYHAFINETNFKMATHNFMNKKSGIIVGKGWKKRFSHEAVSQDLPKHHKGPRWSPWGTNSDATTNAQPTPVAPQAGGDFKKNMKLWLKFDRNHRNRSKEFKIHQICSNIMFISKWRWTNK